MTRSVFMNFASSRFINREAVLEALRHCAEQWRSSCNPPGSWRRESEADAVLPVLSLGRVSAWHK